MSVSELVAISKKISLYPPDRYRFFGAERLVDEDSPLDGEALRGDVSVFRPMLEADLYLFVYARGGCRPSASDVSANLFANETEPDAFFPDLCRLPVEYVQSDGSIVVIDRGIRFRLKPGAFIADFSEARRVRAGDVVRRYRPMVQTGAQSAFIRIVGGTAVAPLRPGASLRFYWNASYSGAHALLEAFERNFSRVDMPILAKRLVDPKQYERRDNVVLYLDRRFATVAREIIVGLYREFSGQLKADVPLFTLPLAPGLGFAEDPVSGASFGQERCRLFADALEARQSGEAFDEALRTTFDVAGLDLDRPHRNALAHDREGGPERWRL